METNPSTLAEAAGPRAAGKGPALITIEHILPNIAGFVGADSVGYLSVTGLHRAVSGDPSGKGYCDACFTGNYPISIPSPSARRQLPLVTA